MNNSVCTHPWGLTLSPTTNVRRTLPQSDGVQRGSWNFFAGLQNLSGVRRSLRGAFGEHIGGSATFGSFFVGLANLGLRLSGLGFRVCGLGLRLRMRVKSSGWKVGLGWLQGSCCYTYVEPLKRVAGDGRHHDRMSGSLTRKSIFPFG